jgi:3',5'-cyclic AMP phosphodiesterase CpdA
MPRRSVKIGLVADIHYGSDADTQLGTQAPRMLEAFREAMQGFRPDAVVDLGDRVNGVAREEDGQGTTWVRRALDEIGAPVSYVFGNTDVVNVPKPELTALLDKPAPYECVERKGLRLLLLDSVDPPIRRVGGAIGRAQMEWLETALDCPGPLVATCTGPAPK